MQSLPNRPLPGRPALGRARRRARAALLLLLAAALPCAAGAVLIGAPDEPALIESLRAEASAYEHGDGVEADGRLAVALYCKAARLGDARSQYALGWLYSNGRGVERSDALAAFFFSAAAEQGYEQAERMLAVVGGPSEDVPECMREPAPVAVVEKPAPQTPPPVRIATDAPRPIADLVERIAPEFDIEPQLALAIIKVESNFDIVALSSKDAKGLMQLIPATAARFNVRNPYDPAQNIRGGLAYLRWLLAYFEGDLTLVAAAYNAGEGAVERYRGVPPYVETRAYVRKVLDAVGAAFHPYDAKVVQPSRKLRAVRAPQLQTR